MRVKIIKLITDCPIPYIDKVGWIGAHFANGTIWVNFEHKEFGGGWFFKEETARFAV